MRLSRSCTSSLRLIPAVGKPGKISFQHLYEGVLPWFPSLFLPVGARRPGVGVPHAPWGVAKRLCYGSPDTTSPHATTAPAQREPKPFAGLTARPPCAACEQAHEHGPQPPGCPATPHRAHARPPAPGGHVVALLPEPGLCLSGWVGWGNLRAMPSQWRSLAAGCCVWSVVAPFSRPSGRSCTGSVRRPSSWCASWRCLPKA